MPLTAPETTSGHPNVEMPRRYPEASGLIAAATVRGTAVMLAAAGRSGGETTAITYELRGGTSICDSAYRASSSAIASGRVGIKGTRMSSRLEGKWVNTIVLTRPMRFARRAATRYEAAERTPVQKKMVPAVASARLKRSKSHSASSD